MSDVVSFMELRLRKPEGWKEVRQSSNPYCTDMNDEEFASVYRTNCANDLLVLKSVLKEISRVGITYQEILDRRNAGVTQKKLASDLGVSVYRLNGAERKAWYALREIDELTKKLSD